ncbi:MAG: pyruvate dehydrogenase (acetyl-transferring), homodimeric type, partial [Betaproteobacteria bacterium]|nr:pyruvate dehydrogenase (acetyl-transferring), homodimeric type [Betaproteobacteria bacterium]
MSALPQQSPMTRSDDLDPLETQEWLDALESVLHAEGPERAHYLIERMIELARRSGGYIPFSPNTAYINTIPPQLEIASPGNAEYEERIRSYIRWNAMAMVVRANSHNPPDGGDLGGHIATFASLATMIGAGMNHFWHAETPDHGGDLVYFQGHAAPGVYGRAFLEGRLTEEQLNGFRQEVDGKGLSSYPHPKLMPSFWQFPT